VNLEFTKYICYVIGITSKIWRKTPWWSFTPTEVRSVEWESCHHHEEHCIWCYYQWWVYYSHFV